MMPASVSLSARAGSRRWRAMSDRTALMRAIGSAMSAGTAKRTGVNWLPATISVASGADVDRHRHPQLAGVEAHLVVVAGQPAHHARPRTSRSACRRRAWPPASSAPAATCSASKCTLSERPVMSGLSGAVAGLTMRATDAAVSRSSRADCRRDRRAVDPRGAPADDRGPQPRPRPGDDLRRSARRPLDRPRRAASGTGQRRAAVGRSCRPRRGRAAPS